MSMLAVWDTKGTPQAAPGGRLKRSAVQPLLLLGCELPQLLQQQAASVHEPRWLASHLAQTSMKVEEGVRQLEKAEKKQKQSRMVLCVMLLLCAVVVLLLLVVFKAIFL